MLQHSDAYNGGCQAPRQSVIAASSPCDSCTGEGGTQSTPPTPTAWLKRRKSTRCPFPPPFPRSPVFTQVSIYVQHSCAFRLLVHRNKACLQQVIGDWVAQRSMEEVLAAMKEASVPSGPILSTADLLEEEQYRSRNMFQTTRPPQGNSCLPSPQCIFFAGPLAVRKLGFLFLS